MQVKQAIQSSANVVRITSVTPGDVYKRFDDSYEDRTYFGLVNAVHNDGEKTIIEATEYCYRYHTLEVSHKILNGAADYTIFPSSPEELNLNLEGARKQQIEKVEEAKTTIAESTKLVAEIDGLMSGQTQKGLKAMSYKELTQEQYAKKIKALAQ